MSNLPDLSGAVILTLLLGLGLVNTMLLMATTKVPPLFISCTEKNDLYQVFSQHGIESQRFSSPMEAIQRASHGAGVLILADDYPQNATPLTPELFALAAQKQLHLFVEYPGWLPEISVAAPQKTQFERGVITAPVFGAQLAPLRIVMLPECYFIPVPGNQSYLALARVAGFDHAVYGLENTSVYPLLFELPNQKALIATSKLSQFITGRYAPMDAWASIWEMILHWLQPDLQVHSLKWTQAAHPTFSATAPLPSQFEHQALQRGSHWLFNARMLLHPAWYDTYTNAHKWWDHVGGMPAPDWPVGDGSLGVLEGFSSNIDYQGEQKVRWWVRNDCNGEVAGMLALAGRVLNRPEWYTIAQNIGDFIYFKSMISQGNRANPHHVAFGLLGWNDGHQAGIELQGYSVYYGDDNARGLLGSLIAANILETDRWNERILQCLLANLRTTGILGFRKNRIDEPELVRLGWRHFYNTPEISYAPHYQAYLWACFLWAYHQTHYTVFLTRTRTGIEKMMAAYPDQWRWTNGLQQEHARMLLPLAWLVRVENTETHRQWLKQMTEALLAHQDSSGAIQEMLGAAGHGSYQPPASNALYGADEAPLLQSNGDPVSDLLYTTNFALLGLHEAAAATGDTYYQDAADRLVKFLCRIQVQSESHPELDGAWFRAIDFKRWEYWASNADAGWGAWSIETGWTQSWILAVLALRQLKQNIWDLTANNRLTRLFKKNQTLMLPNS
ncbi:hypothetical protein L0128_02740 [candidate division KSB1 bacterium]|nr:hypothetical protein [candidate division KSB1 bacterium]